MKNFLYAAVFALVATEGSAQETYEFMNDFGAVSVEEDLLNPRYPSHFISLFPQDDSYNADWLNIRCRNNQTDMFLSASEYEFFSDRTNRSIQIRYFSQDSAQRLVLDGMSNRGSSVFFSNSISQIAELVSGEGVIIVGSYYGDTFRGIYRIDEDIIREIYLLAETCEWRDRLPPRSFEESDELSGPEIIEEDVEDGK